tara:strand:- start:619 stop:1044 length:426 start_codon:yes stop_codon:yes gene_type:complete
MNYKQDEDTYLISLNQNEEIMQTLTAFCTENDILNGQLSGIGAIKDIEIGAYILEEKKYVKEIFSDTWELSSLQGNILLKDNDPFIHAHVTISDHHFNAKGGHLFEATVAVAGEFIIRKINLSTKREYDQNIGLACMALNI